MTRQPRFEIVRTDAAQPWHARFRAANGAIVWTTEQYGKRRAAERAVLVICGEPEFYLSPHQAHPEVAWNGLLIEVRTIDERTPKP